MENGLRRGAASFHCRICTLHKERVCAPFGVQDINLASSYKNLRSVRAGTDLFGQGENCDEVYNLHTGWMFTYLILEDGRRQILSFGLRGGLYGLFPEQVRAMPYGCQALSDVTVCAIPRKQLLRSIQQKPELGLQFAWLGKRDEMLLYEHLTSIGRRSARERVAYLLLELFCRAQQRLPQTRGEAIGLPLNQAHIADAMGLTSIHVSRTLKALREDGVLQLRDGVLEIFDPEKLFEAAVMDGDGASQWIEVFDETPDSSLPEPAEASWPPAKLPAAIQARLPDGCTIALPSSANTNRHVATGQPYIRR